MVRRCVIMMRLARHLVAFIVLALLAAASGLVAESVLLDRTRVRPNELVLGAVRTPRRDVR